MPRFLIGMTLLIALGLPAQAHAQVADGQAFGYRIGDRIGFPEDGELWFCHLWVPRSDGNLPEHFSELRLNVSMMTGTILAIMARSFHENNEELLDFMGEMTNVLVARYGSNENGPYIQPEFRVVWYEPLFPRWSRTLTT